MQLYQKDNYSDYKNKRKQVFDAMENDSILVLTSNDEMPKSGDQNFRFKQNVNLFYLSGITQELTLLVLYKHRDECKSLLFIRETNEHLLTWEGYKLSNKDAKEISGVDFVYDVKDFWNILGSLLNGIDTIYLDCEDNDRVVYTDLQTAQKRLIKNFKNRFPLHNYQRISPVLTALRMIKSDYEIDRIKVACEVSKSAFDRVLAVLRPNIYEYEIEAELIYEFKRRGAIGHAFAPIVAAGKNACVLHYTQNRDLCKDGDLVLIDFGVDVEYYNSDVTRVVPVNGKFTPRQREVYSSVESILEFSQGLLVCGNTFEDYQNEIVKKVEEELVSLKLLDKHDLQKQDKSFPLYKKYFMHGISHFLGLDVHDVGKRTGTMQKGYLLTCEPGIYIKEEGIGIRLENDILITEKGNVNLTAEIPIEIKHIEDIIHQNR